MLRTLEIILLPCISLSGKFLFPDKHLKKQFKNLLPLILTMVKGAILKKDDDGNKKILVAKNRIKIKLIK